MSFGNSSSIRTQHESEPENKWRDTIRFRCNGSSLKAHVLSRVFSEDFEKVKKNSIIDPRGQFVRGWGKVFLGACLVCLFVDPLFFFLPTVQADQQCLDTDVGLLEIVLTVVRSMTDLFFAINMIVRFRTAYVAPSSRVFGRGELVIDPWKIAFRYMKGKAFWFDFVAALPFPQVLIWVIIPNLKGSMTSNYKTSLRFVTMIQYLQRVIIAYPLSIQIAKVTGIVTEKAWLGAAYNLMLYLLSSHVMGSCSYLLSVQREAACWRSVCDQDNSTCNYGFFECSSTGDSTRNDWIQSSNLTTLCDATNITGYPYGIWAPGVSSGVTTASFLQRYFYSLWFGLRSVSTQGQNLTTSIFIGENIYSTVIVILGLFNLALLIGNMQRYLRSTTARIEEWRHKKSDKEQWMHHRQLPQELRESVLRYDRYKWVATYGVNEETLLTDLPKGLRRQIKRHLCLNLVRRVPLLDEMDDRMLDAICERLEPRLWTDGMYIIREGDPLNEMLFIIRGHLDSYTTNGGQTGFYNTCQIGPNDFCGEEMLTWALKKHPSGATLPSSTRTIRAISDVEAFAIRAEALKFVASQFHRILRSKQLRHKLRFYSPQWRTWAACFIQVAWRQYRKRRDLGELDRREGGLGLGLGRGEVFVAQPGSGLAVYASMLMTRIRSNRFGSDSGVLSPMPKPEEPELYADED